MTNVYSLMSSNVGNREARTKKGIIVFGSCVPDQFPDLFENILKQYNYPAFNICLETFHMNMAGYKLASLISYSNVETVIVLTMDGSPHCIQLHYLVEDLKAHFTSNIRPVHYVIEKGKLYQISSHAVKKSRHLVTIEKILAKQK